MGYPKEIRGYYFYSQVNQKVIVSTNVKFLEDDYMMSNKASSDTNWRALMTLPQ